MMSVSIPFAVSHPVSGRRPLGAAGRRATGVRGISEAILRTNGGDTRWWAGMDNPHYTENAWAQNQLFLAARTGRGSSPMRPHLSQERSGWDRPSHLSPQRGARGCWGPTTCACVSWRSSRAARCRQSGARCVGQFFVYHEI
jgi:hypothetical protein